MGMMPATSQQRMKNHGCDGRDANGTVEHFELFRQMDVKSLSFTYIVGGLRRLLVLLTFKRQHFVNSWPLQSIGVPYWPLNA